MKQKSGEQATQKRLVGDVGPVEVDVVAKREAEAVLRAVIHAVAKMQASCY